MTDWWTALAPVSLSLSCGADEHELRWADGALFAPAHPDADRERALAALGAEPSACLQTLDAWNRHADDLGLLMLASRGAADPLDESRLHAATHQPRYGVFATYRPMSATSVLARQAGHPMRRRRFVQHEDEPPGAELTQLLSLGAGLPQRLVATVIGSWTERIEAGDERVPAATPALDAAIYGRLRGALLPWLGRTARIRFTMLPPGAAPELGRDQDTIHAGLPFAWLRDVWINGLAVVLDRFTVGAERAAPGTWMIDTVDRELTGSQTLTISG